MRSAPLPCSSCASCRASHRPSKANEPAFDRAVEQVTQAAHELLAALVTNAPPRDREVEAAKARARAADRFRAEASGVRPLASPEWRSDRRRPMRPEIEALVYPSRRYLCTPGGTKAATVPASTGMTVPLT